MGKANDNDAVENATARALGGGVALNSPSPCTAMRSHQRRAAVQTAPPAAVRWAYAACHWYWQCLRMPIRVELLKRKLASNYGRKYAAHSAPVAASTLTGMRRPGAEFAAAKRFAAALGIRGVPLVRARLRTPVRIDK